MPLFSEALDRFRKNGCFHLNDTHMHLRQLESLVNYIRDNFLRISKLPSRQFHLNQVELIPYYTSEIVEPGEPPESLYNIRIATAESFLLTILNFSQIWDSIQLNRVYSCLNEKIIPLNPNFFTGFKSYSDILVKLTIKTAMLTQESFIKILNLLPALEFLSLELDWSSNRYEWKQLSHVFIEHSNLKYLDFGTTPLDTEAYSALSELLDKNYRIKEINLPEPVDNWALMEIYNQINQRLSEPCWIRFKKEQLSQERLLDVALEALAEVNEVRVIQQKRNLDYGEEGHKSRFNTCFEFLLSSQRELALLNCEKEMWLEEIYVFPKVYGDYSAYVKEYSALFQLHLDTFISTQGKTVGYLLLEKALETKNAKAIEALLKANVNLFEIPPNKEPFLKRALQGRRRCAIKKLLLAHIRKNSSLMELVVGHFSEHSALHDVLKELIDHLSQYGDILIHKNDLPGFLSFTKDIINLCRKMFDLKPPSEKRGEEYAGFQLGLYESIQVATVNGQERPNPDSLSHMQKIVREMIERSSSALLGFANGSELHIPIQIILKKLDVELGKITGITNDPIEQAKIIAEQRNDLAKKSNALQEKDATINNLIEGMERQKVEMEAKHAEERKVMQAGRVQEREEMQAKHAREKLELEEQIERLNNLLEQSRMMNRNTLPEERPRSNAYFFSGW